MVDVDDNDDDFVGLEIYNEDNVLMTPQYFRNESAASPPNPAVIGNQKDLPNAMAALAPTALPYSSATTPQLPLFLRASTTKSSNEDTGGGGTDDLIRLVEEEDFALQPDPFTQRALKKQRGAIYTPSWQQTSRLRSFVEWSVTFDDNVPLSYENTHEVAQMKQPPVYRGFRPTDKPKALAGFLAIPALPRTGGLATRALAELPDNIHPALPFYPHLLQAISSPQDSERGEDEDEATEGRRREEARIQVEQSMMATHDSTLHSERVPLAARMGWATVPSTPQHPTPSSSRGGKTISFWKQQHTREEEDMATEVEPLTNPEGRNRQGDTATHWMPSASSASTSTSSSGMGVREQDWMLALQNTPLSGISSSQPIGMMEPVHTGEAMQLAARSSLRHVKQRPYFLSVAKGVRGRGE